LCGQFGVETDSNGLLYMRATYIPPAGDVRSGSVKRCAAAVGEGSMAVEGVHEVLVLPEMLIVEM